MMTMIMMIRDDVDKNDDDDDPHPSLQLIDLYISIVTNSSRCLCHVLSSVALTIEQLILITTFTR